MKFMNAGTMRNLPQYSKIAQQWDDARERKEKTKRAKELSWKLLQTKDFSPAGIRDFMVAEKVKDPTMQQFIGEIAGTYYKQQKNAELEKANTGFLNKLQTGAVTPTDQNMAVAQGLPGAPGGAQFLQQQNKRRRESIQQGAADFTKNGASSNLDRGRVVPQTPEAQYGRARDSASKGWMTPDIAKLWKPEAPEKGVLANLGDRQAMISPTTGKQIGLDYAVSEKPGAGTANTAAQKQNDKIMKEYLLGQAANLGFIAMDPMTGEYGGTLTGDQAEKLAGMARDKGFMLVAPGGETIEKHWFKSDDTIPFNTFMDFVKIPGVTSPGALSNLTTKGQKSNKQTPLAGLVAEVEQMSTDKLDKTVPAPAPKPTPKPVIPEKVETFEEWAAKNPEEAKKSAAKRIYEYFKNMPEKEKKAAKKRKKDAIKKSFLRKPPGSLGNLKTPEQTDIEQLREQYPNLSEAELLKMVEQV